jgi:hypothetical protein
MGLVHCDLTKHKTGATNIPGIKLMTKETIQLDKNFNREEIETKWYQIWLDNNLFKAGYGDNNKKVTLCHHDAPAQCHGRSA